MGIAAAAVHTLDPHELCCAVPAHAQTAGKDLFEVKKVADGVYAAIAETRYKVNCNAAIILTNDGVIVCDSPVAAPSQGDQSLTAADHSGHQHALPLGSLGGVTGGRRGPESPKSRDRRTRGTSPARRWRGGVSCHRQADGEQPKGR
jgi:hypothetical protein